MKLVRLALGLFALLPFSTFVSATPAKAQSNCRWDLNGEWVGQRTGNRVMQEMRPGGFMVWVVGAPKPGQAEGDHQFRDQGPGAWTWTFPNGSKTFARMESGGLLRVTNPDGWNETFKRVNPAAVPRCVPAVDAASGASSSQRTAPPASASKPLTGPAGNRIISTITHADMREMIESEGHRVDSVGTYQGTNNTTELKATGVMPDGTRYMIFGKDCDQTGVSRCRQVQFMSSYTDTRVRAEHILDANSWHAAVTTAWFALGGQNYVSFSWEMPLESGVPMRVLRSGFRAFLGNQTKAWSFILGKLN